VLPAVLTASSQDQLIAHIVWQNLHPLLEQHGDEFVAQLDHDKLGAMPQLEELAPRLLERLLSRDNADAQAAVKLVTLLTDQDDFAAAAAASFSLLAARTQSGELRDESLSALKRDLLPRLGQLHARPSGQVQLAAAVLAATWKDAAGIQAVQSMFAARDEPARRRLQAFEALLSADEPAALKLAEQTLADKQMPLDFRAQVLSALGRSDERTIGQMVMKLFPQMEPDLQPRAIELLTQRSAWARPLVQAVAEKRLAVTLVNVNQVRRLQGFSDKDLAKQVTALWGTVRTERNPQRDLLIAEIRRFLSVTKGDPLAGAAIFKKVCAQCHKMYGEGQEVGPDITSNGRGSFEQILSNVLDPSLVIGADYQARTVATTDGRILTGLLVEDNDQRVVLKMQGGKLETVPRSEIEVLQVSKLSMMPEDLEKQLTRQEMADLFAFLALNKPPAGVPAPAASASGP
jgi:putative heme-binding domain-containing protein